MNTIKHFISLLLLAFAAHTTSAQVQHQLDVVLVGAPVGAKVVSAPAGIDCPTRGCAALFNQTVLFPFTSGIIRLTATVPEGYSVTWSANVTATQIPNTVDVFLTSPLTVTATFTPTAQLLPLTVTLAGPGTGQVTSNPGGIFCTGGGGNHDCDESYPPVTPATQVTLTAAAHPGSTFTGWSGACAGTGTCVVTMDQARNVTATFDLILELPVIDQAPPPTATFCLGDAVLLTVAAHTTSGAALTYQWRRKNGAQFEAIANGTGPSFPVVEEGIYDVVVSVTGGGSMSTPPGGANVASLPSPAAEPDVVLAVSGKMLVIPLAALLANDTPSLGGTMTVLGVEPAPGSAASVVLDEANAVVRYLSAAGITEDSFSYQLGSGPCSATAAVQVMLSPSPQPALNELLLVLPPVGPQPLALAFAAPASADFTLERTPLEATAFVWSEVVTSFVPQNATVVFADPLPPTAGAIYRVRRGTVAPP